jgi:hypothetical protein
MCGQNVTLSEPVQSLKINFKVASLITNGSELSNCTSFVEWRGEPQFKLLPFTARFDPAMPEEKGAKVVLSITDYLGKVIKLEMFAPRDFYLSITPVHCK